jgi:hypothetical protein
MIAILRPAAIGRRRAPAGKAGFTYVSLLHPYDILTLNLTNNR